MPFQENCLLGKTLDAHYPEYLGSMEQYTKFFCELADVLDQGLPQPSM